MSNESESAQVSDAMEVAQISSLSAVESHAGCCDSKMRLLNDAVRSLPPHVVKDLSSNGVRCSLIFIDELHNPNFFHDCVNI